VAEAPEFIGRYLKHPSREPDYRAGRKHEEFVTSLAAAGYPLYCKEVRSRIGNEFLKDLKDEG
jgi:lipoate-protein ligase A